MAKKEIVSIEKTVRFFRQEMGIRLTDEEARVTTERIGGLFELLDKWNKEHILPPCAAYWLIDREKDLRCR